MFPDLLSFPALSRREHHHSTQNLGADRQQECEKEPLRLELLPITRQMSDEPSRSAARQSTQQEGRPRQGKFRKSWLLEQPAVLNDIDDKLRSDDAGDGAEQDEVDRGLHKNAAALINPCRTIGKRC